MSSLAPTPAAGHLHTSTASTPAAPAAATNTTTTASTTTTTASAGATEPPKTAIPDDMFQTAPSIADSTSFHKGTAATDAVLAQNTDLSLKEKLNDDSDDANTTTMATTQPNMINFNGLSIDQFELDELNKIQHDGIPLQQATPSEINHILSDFPNDIIDDNDTDKNDNTAASASRKKSLIPTEEAEGETETVHLQISPAESLIKAKNVHYEDDIDTTNNMKNTTNNNINNTTEMDDSQKIQAYAMLDFDSFTFYVQTMQILLGRMVEGDSLTDALDIHLGNQKAISRRHAKIFYNFGNQRFELSVLGRNGAFVDGNFVEKGVTVPLSDGTKIQIGETEFAFVLPKKEKDQSSTLANTSTDQIENLDSLVANLEEIRNDIQNDDKLLIPKDQTDIDMVLDAENNKQRELDIEKQIGLVLAREGNEDNIQYEGELSPSDTKKKPSSKSKSKESDDPDKKSKPKRTPKAKKKVYTLEEIPEEYRTKPSLPYSVLITDCLRQKGTERGMSLSEIYKGIQELYPYYFYCPDGWQSSVRHNLSLNKSFRKISKEGKGWLWGVNEEVVAEKDRVRQKQLENSKTKSKSSSDSANTQIQPPTQNLHIHNPTTKNNNSVDSESTNPKPHYSQIPQPQQQSKPQQPKQQLSAPKPVIKNETNTATGSNSNMSANTKKALAYLQKELISLTKSRKMYDRATSTEILTKALAMTISQVDQAAKNFSIKGFPLVILIDKNPGHVTKILTAALNAATLQVCKQKGLTPHLPPKNPTPQGQSNSQPVKSEINKPVAITNSNDSNTIPKVEPSNVPIMHVKKEHQDPIFHKASPTPPVTNGTSEINNDSSSETRANSLTSQSVQQSSPQPTHSSPQIPTSGKPSTGPVVYQFSKPGIKPTFKPAVKPISGGTVKSVGSLGSSAPSIQPVSSAIKPIKQVRLNGVSGTGIIKPQFYNKGKPSTSGSDKGRNGDSISEEEEIRRSLAKFGKPTMKPALESALSNSEKKVVVKQEEEDGEVKKETEPESEVDLKEETAELEKVGTEETRVDKPEEAGSAGKEDDDELDDELHMMLADLEQEDEPDDSADMSNVKKRSVDDDAVTSEDKRVKTE